MLLFAVQPQACYGIRSNIGCGCRRKLVPRKGHAQVQTRKTRTLQTVDCPPACSQQRLQGLNSVL